MTLMRAAELYEVLWCDGPNHDPIEPRRRNQRVKPPVFVVSPEQGHKPVRTALDKIDFNHRLREKECALMEETLRGDFIFKNAASEKSIDC